MAAEEVQEIVLGSFNYAEGDTGEVGPGECADSVGECNHVYLVGRVDVYIEFAEIRRRDDEIAEAAVFEVLAAGTGSFKHREMAFLITDRKP